MMSGTKYPGQLEPPHPELFARPPVYKPRPEPWALTEEQVEQWYNEGYIILDKLFEPEELQPVMKCSEVLVDEIAEILHRTGRIKDTYTKYGLFERMTKMTEDFPETVVCLLKWSAKRFPREVWDLWSHKKLTTIASQLLGTDSVSGHPVWTLRPKVPGTDLAVAPWHQDSGYCDTESYRHMILTAWIPFLNVNKNNGCLQILPGAHRTGKILDHKACWKDTFYLDISDEDLKSQTGMDPKTQSIFAEIPVGGVVIFNNYTPHRSNPHTGEVRWACDFRYMSAGSPGCFHGIGNGVQFTSATDPNFKPQYESFVDEAKRRYVVTPADELTGSETDDLFDLDMGGVWMERWEKICDNKYIKIYEDKKTLNAEKCVS